MLRNCAATEGGALCQGAEGTTAITGTASSRGAATCAGGANKTSHGTSAAWAGIDAKESRSVSGAAAESVGAPPAGSTTVHSSCVPVGSCRDEGLPAPPGAPLLLLPPAGDGASRYKGQPQRATTHRPHHHYSLNAGVYVCVP
jgi:hypothetical protein